MATAGADRTRWVLPVSLAASVLVCFLPSLGNGFVNWDDPRNILQNPNMHGLSPRNLAWMVTDISGHYIPLYWMSLGLDYVLFGLDPAGFHLTSLVLHTANALLCYCLLFALLRAAPCPEPAGSPRREGELRVAAALGALFWAVHPLRVESVVWATERRDVLSGLFFFLTLLAYLRAQREPAAPAGRRRWLRLSLVSFLLSLLSKSMTMTLPLVLLVLDVHPLGRFSPGDPLRSAGKLLREKAPYFVLMALAAVMTVIAQTHVHALGWLSGTDLVAQPGYRIAFYLGKTLLPVRLSPYYSIAPLRGRLLVEGTACGLAVLAGTLVLFRVRRRWPEGLACWAAFLALIAPVASTLQVGGHFAADRNTYFAAVSFAALAAGLVLRCGARKIATRWIALASLSVLGVLSFRQARVWRDSLTLWTHAIALHPASPVAHFNRGQAQDETGDLRGAIVDYTKALELSPTYASALLNRGRTFHKLGDPDRAIADFDKALEIGPRLPDTDVRAREFEIHVARGAARRTKGDLDGAIRDFDEAVRINPRDAKAWNNRGAARYVRGDRDGALADWNEAVRLDPRATTVYHNRALLHAARGDRSGESANRDALSEETPRRAQDFNLRGIEWTKRGRLDKALADFDRAVELDPALARAWHNRGLARAQLGNLDAAITDFDRAIAIDPRYLIAYRDRGVTRAQRGDTRGAAADFHSALELSSPGSPERLDLEDLIQETRETRN